jgi:hypothetical protein
VISGGRKGWSAPTLKAANRPVRRRATLDALLGVSVLTAGRAAASVQRVNVDVGLLAIATASTLRGAGPRVLHRTDAPGSY